jgi:hypothetical protein
MRRKPGSAAALKGEHRGGLFAKVGDNLTNMTKQSLCQAYKDIEINKLQRGATKAAVLGLTI